jgi:N-acetylglucosaminyldiphosphoundecaprenol N-acetyl-beta-D-mannosaminyltransferase
MYSKRLISLDISLGYYKNFIQEILSLAKGKISSYVCVANVHMLIEAYKDNYFQTVVNSADIVTPDGLPLAKGLRILYGIKQDRVAGMDILPDLLKEAERKQLSVYFYGGTQKMMDTTKEFCKKNFPNLKIAGAYSPPFRELTETETVDIVEQINAVAPHFVFVALGCPKQEKWMNAMRGEISACMLGIGGALPVMVGMQKRAPRWMQKHGVEWLFRLLQEPRRLFKRYFVTNITFLYLMLTTYLKETFKKTNAF